jgi:hypothetical protein
VKPTPKKKRKPAKKKKKAAESEPAQGDIVTKEMVRSAVRHIHSHCMAYRSGRDVQLWDLARAFKNLVGHDVVLLLARMFEVGRMHGHNQATRLMVSMDVDQGSYAIFCKKCGQRWSEHSEYGECPNVNIVAPATVEEIL